MRLLARAAVALAGLIAAAGGARPQDAAAVEIEVRENVSLLDAGTPVSGASAAYADDGWGPKDAERGAVLADAQGRVRLDFRGPGGTVLVWAPGRAPAAVRVNAPVPYPVHLLPAVATDVVVTDGAGRPVGDAEVTVTAALALVNVLEGQKPSHSLTLTARTGKDGRARVDGLPDVPLAVTARAEGFVDATEFPVAAARGTTLVLGRGARVAGTLTLVPGGVPAQGATARLGPLSATVGSTGAFAFETVAPGTWTLTFEGTGFTPPAPQTLVLLDGRDRTDLSVVAPRTSSLRGRVVAPAGQSVAALRLVVRYPPEMSIAPREAFVVPSADGTFEVRDLAAADGAAAEVAAPGFVVRRVEGISLPAGDASREIDVRLAPAGGLRGVLLDLEGRPVAGATLVAAEGTPRFPGPDAGRTLTDADGRFSVDGVPDGNAWLRLVGRPPGRETPFGPFAVRAGETTDAGALRAHAGWRVDGRVPGGPDGAAVVASSDGIDVARALLVAGAFTFEGLAAGRLDLRVEADGQIAGTTSVTLPSAWPVTIAFARPVTVSGTIVSTEGRPVPAGRVRAVRLDAEGRREETVRDPSGRFEFRLPPGRWRLEGTDGSGASGALDLTLPGDAVGDVTLTLEPGSIVRGFLVGRETSQPLEGSTVRIVAVGDERTLATALVDSAGRFVARGVPPGIVRVRLETLDRGVRILPPQPVRELDDVDLGTVALTAGTTARIEARAADGSPLADAEVSFEMEGGARQTVRTDPWGRAAARGLAPGEAVLRVRGADGTTIRVQRVDVPWTWEEWTLRIDVAAGTRVWGRVSTGGRDEAFARVTLRLAHPVPTEVATVADAQGRYTLPQVPPGTGEVEVGVAGATVGWRRPVRVTGGLDQLLDVELPESGVSGSVETFDGGSPVAGARIEVRRPGDPDPVASGVSGDDGRFVLRRVAPGTYDVVAERAGNGAAWLRGVVVTQGADVAGLRVVMPPEGRINLRVLDLRGRPVSSAWATATVADGEPAARGPVVTAWADAAGRVVLRGVSRGPWRVAVGAPGASRTELGIVRADEGDIVLGDVTLGRGGALRVATIDGWGGRRLGGVEVVVRDVYGLDPRLPRRPDDAVRGPDPAYVSGQDGILDLTGLAPGTYHLHARGRPDAEVSVRVRAETVTTALVAVPREPPPEGVLPDAAPPAPPERR